MDSHEPPSRSGRNPGPHRPPGRLQAAPVREAAAALCRKGTPVERLRSALAEAEAKAFAACGHGQCETCERLWGATGLACEQRRVRRLVKRAVMALLPLMDRRCTLDAAWSALADAISGVPGCEKSDRSPLAG